MSNNGNKTIVKNTIFLSLRMVFVTIVYIYSSRIILNALGVVDYGIYNVIGGFVSMFGFLNLSMANGIQRFYNYEKGANDAKAITSVYNTALVIQVLLAVVIFVLLESVGVWYLYNEMVIPVDRFDIAFWIFQLSVFTSLLSIFQIPYQAAIMSYEKMDYYAVVSVFDVLLNLTIAVMISFIPVDNLLLYGLLTAFRAMIVFAMYFIYSIKNFTALVICGKIDKKLLKDMLMFSGWNLFGTFGGMAKDQGVNMILNLFFGPVVNAAKGVATQVSGAVQGFVSNISIAVRPQLTGSYACGDKNRVFQMMYSLTKISFITLYIFSLPLMLEIDYILKLWLGNVVPLHANSFIVIAILLNFLNVYSSSFSALIHSSGKLKWYQISGAICNILVLPFSYFFLEKGCTAVFAYSITIVFVLINLIITVILLRKIEQLSIIDYCKKVISPLFLLVVTTLIFPLIPLYILQEGFFRLIIVTVVSTLVILLASYLFVADLSERLIVKLLIKKIIKKYK